MADLSKFKRAITEAFTKATSAAKMREYGESAAQYIRVRTRTGYGVKENGKQKTPLKALSDEYKKQRKKSRLHGSTSPGKSNLTRTGELLESLKSVDPKQGIVFVSPTGTRSEGLKNEKLAEYVAEQGRPFNHLTDTEQSKIRKEFEKVLRQMLKNAFR